MAETTTMDNMNSTAMVDQGNGILSNLRRFTSDPSFQKSTPTIIAVVVAVLGLVIYLAMPFYLLRDPIYIILLNEYLIVDQPIKICWKDGNNLWAEIANIPKYKYFNANDDHMMDYNEDLVQSIRNFIKTIDIN